MTEQPPGQGSPDDWDRGGYVPGEQYYGEQYYDSTASSSPPGPGGAGNAGRPAGTPGPGNGRPGAGGPGADGPGAGPAMPTAPLRQAAQRPQEPAPGTRQPWGSPSGEPARGAGQPWGSPPGTGQPGPGRPRAPQPGPAQQAPPPPGTARPEPGQPGVFPPGRQQDAGAKGFFGALFDLSFTSFVTTRIIKVLYALIMVLTILTALFYTIITFRISVGFGLVTLVIGDPLFIIIVMAFWRLVLESFVVLFRIAEDVRALRERNDR